MKRLTSFLVILFVAFAVFAGDLGFVFKKVEMNSEIFAVCPTLLEAGVSYDGLGEDTQLQLLLGGGLEPRKLTANPVDGTWIDDPSARGLSQVAQARWTLSVLQDLGSVTGYVTYSGRWERFMDSFKDQPLDSWLAGFGTTRQESGIYKDLATPDNFINSFALGIKYDTMDDRMVATDGVKAYAEVVIEPNFACTNVGNMRLNADAVYAKTLYEKQRSNGLNLFSIVLMDRLDATAVTGRVPSCDMGLRSLGKRLRGVETGRFSTTWSVVNNLEVRLSSPEPVDGIFARLNIFADAGFFGGHDVNRYSGEHSGFVASAGFQADVCLMDILDVGIQYAWTTCSDKADMSIIFKLDY